MDKKCIIVVTCGKIGTGKDTVANYLCEKYGFTSLSFAYALKMVCSILFNWDMKILQASNTETRKQRELLPNRTLCGREFNVRTALQYMGTDLFRKNFGEDIWVDILKNKIDDIISTSAATSTDIGNYFCTADMCTVDGSNNIPKIVISDCRFLNEIAMLESYGANFICLYRNNEDLEPKENEHISEHDFLKKIDIMDKIYNNHGEVTMENLHQKIDMLMQNLKK